MSAEATIELASDGTYRGASPAALEILGVTLEELLALPPGAFATRPADPVEQESFRQAWEAAGSPPIGGEGTILRPDGSQVRLSFAIIPRPDGTFVAAIERIPTSEEAEPVVYTMGSILSLWRAAERDLATVVPGTAEWHQLTDQVETFRARYQQLFAQRRRGGTT